MAQFLTILKDSSASESDKISAARKLQKVITSEMEIELIELLKREKSTLVKYDLLHLLKDIGTESALDVIISYLGDKNLIHSVIGTLLYFKHPKVVAALTPIILNHKDDLIRKSALAAIINADIDEAIDLLIQVINKDKMLFIRRKIVEYFDKKIRQGEYDQILPALIKHEKKEKDKILKKQIEELIEKSINIFTIGEKNYTVNLSGKSYIYFLDCADLSDAAWDTVASKITHIYIEYGKVKSLKGIEKLANLKKLEIYKTQLEDISSIEGCKNLEEIEMVGNKIKSIKGLENHPKLKEVNLSKNNIENLDGLTGLPQLKTINLSENRITYFKNLLDLTNLVDLNLLGNEIKEIPDLSNIKKIHRINLVSNKITDVTPLATLPKYIEIILYLNRLPENLEGRDFRDLIDFAKGKQIKPKVKRYPWIPTIFPLYGDLLEKNREDKCLYCKATVIPGKNSAAICQKIIGNIISQANKKLPLMAKVGTKTTVEVLDCTYTTVLMNTKKVEIWRREAIMEGLLKFNEGTFDTLPGTICDDCIIKFTKKAESFFKKISTSRKGKIKYWKDKAGMDYKQLFENWIDKAINN